MSLLLFEPFLRDDIYVCIYHFRIRLSQTFCISASYADLSLSKIFFSRHLSPDKTRKSHLDFESGKVARLNKRNPRPAIFIDRDGTINEEVNLLNKPEQLKLIDGVAEAIRLINKSDYLAIIVTNQPVIARNLCSIEELEYIHASLETILGKERAYVNAIYYCPHHPDKGYPEERPEYKIDCECRKPKPGMLLQAAKDWNIDIANSYMIGDSSRDLLAGQNAGCKDSIVINTNEPNALLEAVKIILNTTI